jgi:hypothetical protein
MQFFDNLAICVAALMERALAELLASYRSSRCPTAKEWDWGRRCLYRY